MKHKSIAQEYIDFVPEKKALERLNVLNHAFETTREVLELGEHDKHVKMNLAILSNANYSYWYDIKRLRDFHGFDLINRPKKAAYLIKWLVKEKPIYFDPEPFGDDDILEVLSCINEYFAIRAGCSYAGIPITLVAPYISSLVYELSFREPSPGMLALWFEQLMSHHGLSFE